MAGYFSVDPAYTAAGTINTSAPLCEVDNYLMKKNKFYAKLENNNKVAAARQLKFHSEEVVTQVQNYIRKCNMRLFLQYMGIIEKNKSVET